MSRRRRIFSFPDITMSVVRFPCPHTMIPSSCYFNSYSFKSGFFFDNFLLAGSLFWTEFRFPFRFLLSSCIRVMCNGLVEGNGSSRAECPPLLCSWTKRVCFSLIFLSLVSCKPFSGPRCWSLALWSPNSSPGLGGWWNSPFFLEGFRSFWILAFLFCINASFVRSCYVSSLPIPLLWPWPLLIMWAFSENGSCCGPFFFLMGGLFVGFCFIFAPLPALAFPSCMESLLFLWY